MTRRILILVMLSLPCGWAQVSLPGTSSQVPPATVPADPLGRDTPRSSMLGFVSAAQRARYQTAAQYLQVPHSLRETTGVRLASQLRVLMDQGYFGNLDLLSDRRDGTVDDGLPPQRERVGAIQIDDDQVQLILVRAEEDNRPVWLVSAETLREVPSAYQRIGVLGIEARLPSVLVERRLLQMPLWQWAATLLFLPVALAAGWILVSLVLWLGRLAGRGRTIRKDGHSNATVAPLTVMAGLFIHWMWVYAIRMPLLYRQYYNRVLVVMIVAVATWMLWRLLDRWVLRARERAMATGQVAAGSLMVLGRRVIKVMLVTVLLLVILAALGFRITPLLTGLGIGGIALALAAQKTIENFIGGVSVLSDQVIRVGDMCRFGDKMGHIEDIGLRSTRIRTLDRTELSIPNGAVATMNVENFSLRDKIMVKTTFGLRYDTSSDQLRCVLADVRRVLYSHPLVETESARARLISFATSSLEIELFFYIITPDFGDFAAAREDILIRVMEIVESAGAQFAFPSQTVYLARDRVPDKHREAEASRRVTAWKEQSDFPFPDFAPETISAMQSTIVYPPPGAALQPRRSTRASGPQI
jgi:MscS family membrane protein